MIRIAPSRLLSSLLFAIAAAFIWPAPASAIDEEPVTVSEDVGEDEGDEVLPPGAEDETSPSARFREDRPERPRAAEKPEEAASPKSKSAVRDEATRTLLSEPKEDKPNPLLDSRGPDYYDRRAKELLKEDENRGVVTLHPLMEDYPDSYVVVCAAGCPNSDRAKIVSMLPKRKPDPEPVSTPAAEPDVLSCVAGCGERGSYTLAAAPAAAPVPETVGEWMTTLAKVPAGAETPAPKAGGSGDWMSKINEDRAGGKPIAASAPIAAVPANPDVKAAPPADAPEVKAVTEAKPAAPAAPVVAAKPAEPKPAAAPEAKPAAPVVAAKPAEPKPAVAPEVKPAAPVVAAKPDETKPAAVPEVKTAAPVVAAKPAEPKPAAAPEVKPAAPVVAEIKPAAPVVGADAKPAVAPVAPAPETKFAALETPKAAAPAPAAAAPRREAETPAEAETKVAAVAPPVTAKPSAAVPPKTKDGVISVLSEDKDMNAAIAKARGSLGAFWKSHATPATAEADHALKVAIAGNGTTEHFWLTRIKRDNGKLSGVISNQPQSVTSVKMGQRFEFSEDMISDWTFKRNGKLVGNETMRVLLPRMPAEQASVYRNMYETP